MSAAYNPGYNRAVAITKSDTANFDGSTSAERNATPCDALFIGGAGDVVVVFPDSTTVTFTCVAAQLLPVKCIRVNSTSTTATVMRALYNI